MGIIFIIYFAGCAVSFVGGIISDKLDDNLTIRNLITVAGFSLFSWMLIIIIIGAAAEEFVRNSDRIQDFLDKKL